MPIIQLIATIVLSGVVSGALIFGLQERRERAALLVQKAENAVEAFVAWTDQMQKWPIAHFDLFLADAEGRTRARSEIRDMYSEAGIRSARAQMLVHIYLPDQLGAISLYLQSFSSWIKISAQLQQASLEGAPFPDWAAASIGKVGGDMVEAKAAATAKLYDAARNLAHAPFIVRWRLMPRLRLLRSG